MKNVLLLFENWTTIVAFAIVVISAFGNVLSRYVFGTSFAFTSELTVNLAVYVAIVGSVIALRENSHLGFSLFVDRSQGVTKKGMLIFAGVAIATFYAVVAYYSLDLAISQAQRGTVTPALGVPNYLYTSMLVLGGVLGLIRSLGMIATRTRIPSAELVAEGE